MDKDIINSKDESQNSKTNKKKINKEHKYGLVGFLLGGVIAFGITYLFLNNSQQNNLENISANASSSASEDNESKAEDDSITSNEELLEEQQSLLEEGVVQDQATDNAEINNPTYIGSQINKEVEVGSSSIIINKIERGATFNLGSEYEKYENIWLRVYFSIKNQGDVNKQYAYNDFTMEESGGEVINSRVDFGLGEFGFSTLVPNAVKKGFVLFKTSTNSGKVVWLPSGESSPAKISFKVN
jgi:hypothetical protein